MCELCVSFYLVLPFFCAQHTGLTLTNLCVLQLNDLVLATRVVPGLVLLFDTVISLTVTGLNALANGFSEALLAEVTAAHNLGLDLLGRSSTAALKRVQ